MEEEQVNPFKGLEAMLEDINKMMLRWKAGKMIKHMDLNLFERVVRDRFDLERQLMIASETIEVLSTKLHRNEIILKHFNEDDRRFLRSHINRRKQRAAAAAKREAEKEAAEKEAAQLSGAPEQPL